MMESIKRLPKQLEENRQRLQGVNQCSPFRPAASRVMVDAENVTDERAAELSFEISQKIEKKCSIPARLKSL
jgi:ribonuclease Y